MTKNTKLVEYFIFSTNFVFKYLKEILYIMKKIYKKQLKYLTKLIKQCKVYLHYKKEGSKMEEKFEESVRKTKKENRNKYVMRILWKSINYKAIHTSKRLLQ